MQWILWYRLSSSHDILQHEPPSSEIPFSARGLTELSEPSGCGGCYGIKLITRRHTAWPYSRVSNLGRLVPLFRKPSNVFHRSLIIFRFSVFLAAASLCNPHLQLRAFPADVPEMYDDICQQTFICLCTYGAFSVHPPTTIVIIGPVVEKECICT